MMNMTQNLRSKQQNIVQYWQKYEHKNFVTIRTQFNFDKKNGSYYCGNDYLENSIENICMEMKT